MAAGPVAAWAYFSSEVNGAGGQATLQAYDAAVSSEIHPDVTAPAQGVVGHLAIVQGNIVNSGAVDHHDVVVNIDAPGADIAYAWWGDAQVPCTLAGSTATCHLGTLSAHEYRPLTVGVVPDAAGTIAVQVSVTSSTAQQSPDPVPDTQSLSIAASDPFVDLGVEVTYETATPTLTASYQLNVATQNHGNVTAPGTVLSVTVPPGFTLHSGGPASPQQPGATNCTIDGNTATCPVGDLAPGARQEVRLFATVTTAEGGDLVIAATSSIPEITPNDHPDVEIRHLVVDDASADVRVTLGGPSYYVSGQGYTVSAGIYNDGPAATSNEVVVAQVPDGWVVTSATIGFGTCAIDDTTVTCAVPTVYSGENSLTMQTVAGPARADATFSVTAQADLPDLQPANNTAARTVEVKAREVDLGLSSNASSSIAAGVTHDVTISVTNAGPAVAQNVVATATFPAGVEVTGAVAYNGSCAIAGQTVTCTFPSMASSTYFKVTLRHITFGAPSTYEVSVTSDQPEAPAATHPNTLTITRMVVAADARLRVRTLSPSGLSLAAQVRVYRDDDSTTPVIVATAHSFTWHTLPYGHQYRVEVVLAGYGTSWWGGSSFATATVLDAQGLSEYFDVLITMPYA